MVNYADNPEWADIVPIPQDEGGPNPLAAIAYSDEYSEAMSYLRAVMADQEMSERVLGLTAHVIDMNPAHYTVWYELSPSSSRACPVVGNVVVDTQSEPANEKLYDIGYTAHKSFST